MKRKLTSIYAKFMEPKRDPHPVILCNEREVIFVHILKTAGTSVIDAIGQGFKLHIPVTEIIRRVGRETFDRAYTFSFVRNPWDKVYSHYRYHVKTDQQQMKSRPIDFTDWVSACFGIEKNYFYYHRQIQYTDQLSWLEDENGNMMVDFVGRFENLTADFATVCRELGIPSELPHLNKTQNTNDDLGYREVYDERSREIVAKAFARDIALFNYRF